MKIGSWTKHAMGHARATGNIDPRRSISVQLRPKNYVCVCQLFENSMSMIVREINPAIDLACFWVLTEGGL